MLNNRPHNFSTNAVNSAIEDIRCILVKTLSSENVSKNDVLKVRSYNHKNHYNKSSDSSTKQNLHNHVAEKEARLRSLKERQNEERQKKLEEIKAQALAAQRFKEQKEMERRKRLDDLRVKDDIRRQQVEERKRAINDAEKDRLESILKRNQEREVRLEAKKRNERSSIVFAFGSSTPRMLEPTELSASFWGHRRATSTQNIPSSSSSLTRRQSERDLDTSSKKRATSASGLERSGESSTPTTPAGCASGYIGRRRTDLMPTVPSRDASFTSSRKSLNHSPGRAYSMSRLDQLSKPRKRPDLPMLAENSRPLSSSRLSNVTRSMSHLAVSKQSTSNQKRPLSKADSRSMHQLGGGVDGSHVVPRTTRATQLRQQKLIITSSNCSEASSRPSSSLSHQSTNSVTSSVNLRHRATPKRPRPASIAVTGVTSAELNKPPIPKARKTPRPMEKSTIKQRPVKSPVDNNSSTPKSLHSPSSTKSVTDDIKVFETVHEVTSSSSSDHNVVESSTTVVTTSTKSEPTIAEENTETISSNVIKESNEIVTDVSNTDRKIEEPPITVEVKDPEIILETKNPEPIEELVVPPSENGVNESGSSSNSENKDNNEMTTSITKPRITTEEEAKAALAERRRLIREETERQAEMERLRIEAEHEAELERQRKEEEQVRMLVEMQRQAEQERLQEAIRDTQRREEEERLRKEEEQRLKQLKEEAEKKAKEEAERQKAELQEKLKNEEKEREMRRKRVEAIMLRTRGKNNSNLSSQQNSEDKNENKSANNSVHENINHENNVNEKLNGKTENGTVENNSKNEKDIEIVDNNIIPDETSVKNANNVSDSITSTDALNSNNSTTNATWQQPQQQYGNFVYNNNS